METVLVTPPPRNMRSVPSFVQEHIGNTYMYKIRISPNILTYKLFVSLWEWSPLHSIFVVIFVYLPLFMFCFEIHSRLTVTDSDGASSSENAYITVEPEKDDPPTADTGGSVHKIRLPLDHITIRANKSQDDHGIKEYKWEQIDTSDEDKLININVCTFVFS